jgi:hypothetical protein
MCHISILKAGTPVLQFAHVGIARWNNMTGLTRSLASDNAAETTTLTTTPPVPRVSLTPWRYAT